MKAIAFTAFISFPLLLVALPTPKYLSIPGFKKCLAIANIGSWNQYCLPPSQPKSCLDNSWNELTKLDIPKCQKSSFKTTHKN